MIKANRHHLIEKPMEKLDLEAMPLDDLWTLHEQISKILSTRIIAEKRQLENRLVQLNRGKAAQGSVLLELKSSKTNQERPRRSYPRVFPKYQNPAVPSETWSGRGRQPRWLVSALKAGGRIEDFKIQGSVQDKVRARR
jgi:DNA-binding protein H-NS